MAKKMASKSESCDCKGSCSSGACSGGIYGLGFLGALIYYISISTSFWMGLVGVFKSLVWPVFLVYELLKFLSA